MILLGFRASRRQAAPLLIAALLLRLVAPAAAAGLKEIARETVFGQQGSEDGEFKAPGALTLTPEREILVADAKRDTVSRFTQYGKFLGQLRTSSGPLEGPSGVAVDSRGSVFVVENRKNRIRKFDAKGVEAATIGRTGSAPGLFGGPRGIACDSRGHLYVADYYNGRIQELDNDGRFVRAYTYQPKDAPAAAQPRAVGVDLRDRPWGVYPLLHKVCRFDTAGKVDVEIGSFGRQPGQFNDPRCIAFDIRDNAYVTDGRNHRIQKFSESGVLAGVIGSRGSGSGQLLGPQGLALDPEGNLYVADGDNYRVQLLMVNDFRRNLNLGLHHFRLSDFQRSSFHYEEVLRSDPGQKEAAENLVTAYRKLSERALGTGDVGSSKRYLASILKLKPGNADARKKLRGLVWEENRSEIYYPTVLLGIGLAALFMAGMLFRFVRG